MTKTVNFRGKIDLKMLVRLTYADISPSNVREKCQAHNSLTTVNDVGVCGR